MIRHVVVKGDTLNAIAARYGVARDSISQQIDNPDFIKVGWTLLIPVDAEEPPAEEPPVEEPPAEEPPTEEPPAEEPPAEEPPASSDRPNGTNTGHDGNLTRTFGAVKITQAWLDANNGGSKVVENVRFTGTVTVAINNLTLRNFAITGGTYGVDNGVFSGNPTTGLVLEDGELTGQGSSALLVSNTTARRLHVHHQAADAVKAFRNVEFADSFVHHLGSLADSHADGVQMVNGGNVTISGNNFDMRHDEPDYNNTQVMIIQTNLGPIDNVLIEGNWINGGGYSVQIIDKGAGHGFPKNVRIVDNRFGRDYQFGLLRFKDGTPVEVARNVWDDTGQPI